MTLILLRLTLTATPAFAHHEVVMATSVLPSLAWLAALCVAAYVGWRRR